MVPRACAISHPHHRPCAVPPPMSRIALASPILTKRRAGRGGVGTAEDPSHEKVNPTALAELLRARMGWIDEVVSPFAIVSRKRHQRCIDSLAGVKPESGPRPTHTPHSRPHQPDVARSRDRASCRECRIASARSAGCWRPAVLRSEPTERLSLYCLTRHGAPTRATPNDTEITMPPTV